MLNSNQILTELEILGSTLGKLSRLPVQSVPEGYFEHLPAQIYIQCDHKITLTGSVPDGYFEQLSQSILNKLNAPLISSETESLADSFAELQPGIKCPYKVPEGYFEHFIQQLEPENTNLSVLPDATRNIQPFTVPNGYFDLLPEQVLQEIKKKTAPVIPINRSRTVFMYALAAVLTGLLGISLFNNLFTDAPNTDSLSNSKLAALKEADQIIKENSFDLQLENLTDESIVNYLSIGGQDVSAALVASVTDESKLPEAEEYLYDEQTLDNFLNGLHLQDRKDSQN